MVKTATFILTILLICSFSLSANGQIQPKDTVQFRDSIVPANVSGERSVSRAANTMVRLKEIRAVISPIGEPDAISFVKTLPGVSMGVEGSNAFYVRGGNMGNNLISLDNVSIYGFSHLLGFTSVLPSAIISNTQFYKGGFSSEDGNLLSSHIKITSKDGSFAGVHGGGGISNVLASAWVSVPIIKNRLSFIASGRYSPIQWEYNAFSNLLKNNPYLPDRINAGVYDAYAKLKYRISDTHALSLSFFNSHDKYGYNVESRSGSSDLSSDRLGWDNLVAAINWEYRANKRTHVTVHFSYNSYKSFQEQERRIDQSDESRLTMMNISSAIREMKLFAHGSWAINSEMALQFGVEGRNTYFNPGSFKAFDEIESPAVGNPMGTWMAVAHAQWMWEHKNLKMKAAARMNGFFNGKSHSYDPEFRFLVNYQIIKQFGVEVTFDYLTQYYHTLEGIPTGMSTDMIIPSGEYAPPEHGIQAYAGVYAGLEDQYSVTAGVFYKTIGNTVYFRNASNLFSSTYISWKEDLEIGRGDSRGLELYAEKTGGNFTGHVSYTLSKANRTYQCFNDGNPIPFQFDRRHVLSVNGAYELRKGEPLSHIFSTNFTLSNGHWDTMVSGTYLPDVMPGREDVPLKYYTHPNNYQLPMYIRWDISYQINIVRPKTRHHVSIGVFNLLNRHNVYSLFWDAVDSTWKQLSILPIMPNFNYQISF